MTISIITVLYVLSVFLARYFNMKIYKKDSSFPIWWFIWFIPIAGFLVFLIVWGLVMNFPKKNTWFTGKNW